MYIKKYSALIIVNLDGTIKVKQYEDSTACQNAYRQAISSGLDAYCYFMPAKRGSAINNPNPIEVTL
jgi:hypothetical protein